VVSVRRLAEADLERVEDGMPLWSRTEYRLRLSAQLVATSSRSSRGTTPAFPSKASL
jgi:hypothetical protein